MSADILREAASLMRERAEAALASLSDNVPEWHSVDALMGEGKTQGDAEHIASWHPAVALAVADLIELADCNFNCDERGMRSPYCYRCSDSGDDHDCPPSAPCTHTKGYRTALTVARAYLGADQ